MCVVKIHTWSSKLPHPKGSSETHFQTAFCYFAKQIFPPPSPQTSSEPVNSPCFNNFLKQTMSGIYLPRLFPPHIAERGLLYFQQGKVRDVQKTSAGRYRAEVCGSENYSVWLKLDSDLYIKDGGCDCPYGWACKHMAALWYAVRAQTPDGQPDESDAQQPKKGGNPYRQQLSKIFSRTRYYDYYEAADLGFSKL